MRFSSNDIKGLPIDGNHFTDLATLSIPDLVLRSHLMAEQLIEYFISSVSGESALTNDVRLTFTQKLAIAKNLGLHEDLYKFLKKLNSLRNKFAHNLDYQIDLDVINVLRDLNNNCFESKMSKVQDNTIMTMPVKLYLGPEVIERNLKLVYKETGLREKFLIIVVMFLGTKFLNYLLLVSKDCEEMDSHNINRIKCFKMNSKRYHVSET